MSQPDTISLQEIADIFGMPFAVNQVYRDLTAEGYQIITDWAGRPALTFRDAERKVRAWRKVNEASQAEYAAAQAMRNAVHTAQLERDRMFEAEYVRLRHSSPLGGDPVASMQRDRVAASKTVLAIEKENGLPRDVQKQLGWLTLDRMSSF